MRPGARAVAGQLARRVTLLLLVFAGAALFADPRANGVLAGFLVLAAMLTSATVFGVAGARAATPPRALFGAAVLGLVLAAIAGVWGSSGAAFAFWSTDAAGVRFSVGGAATQIAAALAVAGAGGFIFLCLAGRAVPLGDDSGDDAP